MENSASAFQQPYAPRLDLKELPQNEDTIPFNDGNGQWIPQHSLFVNHIGPQVDHRLAMRPGPRAVAQPLLACGPVNTESPDYLWGAVGNPVLMGGDTDTSTTVDFERVYDPATEPPVAQMIIYTDAGDFITVDAEQGGPYITVVDVQKAVIRWMKEMRSRSGIDDLTVRFSRWLRMEDVDGTEADMEIWVWEGLKPLTMDLMSFHLHLCDA